MVANNRSNSPVVSRFSDQDTEAFYDAEDGFYRSFWDREGSLHWGVFDEDTGRDFLKACANLSRVMSSKAQLDGQANVLDIGCGNGAVAAWLCRSFGCHVTGVDLSGVRIENAREIRLGQSSDVQERLHFAKSSATELPYDDGSFSHVWSQATIYHVHDKEKVLAEAHRVLAPGGRFVFDDLLKPTPDISEDAQTFAYDRLLFDTDFSFASYQKALRAAGFDVLEALDISEHLKTSYDCLAQITAARASGPGRDKFEAVNFAYRKMAEIVERGELGWGLYVCERRQGSGV